ncbi:MAG TPA: hypothetical protein VIF09_07415 [Polyangiaceae bacterium]|jgi:hypothetical protein
MGYCLAATLVVFAAAHVALVVGLARRGSWRRAALAMVVAPLAPWWGRTAGMRVVAIAWCAALALYTVGIAVAGALAGSP